MVARPYQSAGLIFLVAIGSDSLWQACGMWPKQIDEAVNDGDDVDPRRDLWRRGSYEIVGDWLAPASLSVLDAVDAPLAGVLAGQRVLDLATGTGTVAIEAARRGAGVTGVDLTDELLEIARQRASAAGVQVRFLRGDFDQLSESLGDEVFDVVTSSFGVIFAPSAEATLGGLTPHVATGGLFAVAGWDPAGVFIVPESMLELLPERPNMPDMTWWTTRIEELCAATSWEVTTAEVDELHIPFESVEDAADQLERWSGGFGALLEMFDQAGVGPEARTQFVSHLGSFVEPTSDGVLLRATYFTNVLRPVVT